MPGLHNTGKSFASISSAIPFCSFQEQWKRIACRIGQASPPLSRQYCQTAACIFEPPDEYFSEILGTYPRPTSSESQSESTSATLPLFHTPRCKIILGLLFAITVIAVLVSVIIAVIFGN